METDGGRGESHIQIDQAGLRNLVQYNHAQQNNQQVSRQNKLCNQKQSKSKQLTGHFLACTISVEIVCLTITPFEIETFTPAGMSKHPG